MLSTRASDVMRLTSPIATLELPEDGNDDDECGGSSVSTLSAAHLPLHTVTASVVRTTTTGGGGSGANRLTVVTHASTALVKTRARFADVHVVMALLMSVVGSGMLSVPFTFVLIPTAHAVAGLVVVAVSMASTATALVVAFTHAARKQEQQQLRVGAGNALASLQALARHAGGDALALVVSLVTALGIFGGCVGGLRIVRDLTPHIARLLLQSPPGTHSGRDAAVTATNEHEHAMEAGLLWGSVVLVVLPLCLLKHLSALRVTNYLGFVCSIYLVLAVAYRSLEAASQSPQPLVSSRAAAITTATPDALWTGTATHLHIATDPVMAAPREGDTVTDAPSDRVASFVHFAQATSIYNFAFMMHLNLLPLCVQLRGAHHVERPLRATRSRMVDVVVGVAGFCLLLYAALGVCGAQLYGAAIRGNLLLNLESDAAMAIPLLAVFATMLATFPLLFHPLRSIVEDLLLQIRSPLPPLPTTSSSLPSVSPSLETRASASVSFATRFMLTLALLGSALLLATQVPGVEVVFSLIGATTCALICFVFPVVIFTRVWPWRSSVCGMVCAATLWLIVVFELIIGATTVWSLL